MTNGQVTKKILAACKKETGETLRRTVSILLHSFPLSSYKLVYDSDALKVPAEAWAILIEACIESDKRKCEGKNSYLTQMGITFSKEDKSFGRFSG
jgi:hypothetical protein